MGGDELSHVHANTLQVVKASWMAEAFATSVQGLFRVIRAWSRRGKSTYTALYLKPSRSIRDHGWVRVQSWHGGKLLMLYVPVMAAAVLWAFSATAYIDDEAGAVIFVTTALLLVTCATMLLRATWNWFTGRETQRKAIDDGAGPEPPQVPRP